jgi:cold shock CspA family protein
MAAGQTVVEFEVDSNGQKGPQAQNVRVLEA